MIHILHTLFSSLSLTMREAAQEGSGTLGWFNAITGLVGGCIGALAGSYWKKSGEIKAIRDNIELVKQDQKEIREATKQVESKIEQQYWHYQRLWDLKRKIGFEAVKQIAALSRSFALGQAALNEARKRPDSDEVLRLINKAKEQHEEAQDAFWQAQATMQLIFPELVIEQMNKVAATAEDMIRLLEPAPVPQDQQAQLVGRFYSERNQFSKLIRNEMLKPTPSSSEAPAKD
jgi:hypothetical protein